MTRLFGHGDLRLYMLKLLDERPRHGYEIIRALEDRFYGLYTPSAGTIYPRLASMEEDGFIAHEVVDGRKVYRLTDAGRAELADRREEMENLEDRVRTSSRNVAREIRADVKESIRDLREELRAAAGQVRREERRVRRSVRDDVHEDLSREVRRAVRSVQAEASSFAADVVEAVRSNGLDRDILDALRRVLTDARSALADVIDGSPRRAPADRSSSSAASSAAPEPPAAPDPPAAPEPPSPPPPPPPPHAPADGIGG